MQAKGKAPKVPIAAARREPVADIPEGSEPQGSVTRPVRAGFFGIDPWLYSYSINRKDR